jgi:phenylacetyl-CoA:acceptor oxidoreductase
MPLPPAACQERQRKVAIYCNQCVSGPDLFKVVVEEGVARAIEPNFDVADAHPAEGRVCVKAYGLIQKAYNPNRITTPMKRTNPKKGRDQDPGFVAISWDEALDRVADKLKAIKASGVRDEQGYPKLAVSFGGGGTPARYMGSFPAFLSAVGPADFGFGSGQGAKCYHSEHLYGELWHRAFTVIVDSQNCDYILNFGHNMEASGGPCAVWRQANARVRGLKRVQIEPHLSITGATSAEWVPIKPKSDPAFLFAVIHRVICERDWRQICDIPFLGRETNSPYLVGPNGFYLRDPESRKPLIWDAGDKCAKPHDADIIDPALEGGFQVTGLEEGADGEVWHHDAVEAKPAFQLLIEHMADYTPEWAENECDVAAEIIRRIADEFVAHARVGETIEIDGEILPLRPVGIMLGKGINNGWGGYHMVWGRTMLACLVGALEVPGGTLGSKVRINRPARNRLDSVQPGEDGFMSYPFNATDKENWRREPGIRNGFETLVPLAGNSPWSAALGPAHLPWLFQQKQPAPWPRQTLPEMWLCYRTNPAISSWNAPEVAERIAEFPFTVAFAYTLDETNYMADILLPDAIDIESLQLSGVGATGSGENSWRHHGWAVRQAAIEPPGECRDMTDVATELAIRTGVLPQYNAAINRGAAGAGLSGKDFDYSLDPEVRHSCEEIWEAVAKAASHELTDGEEVVGIDWFKENGVLLRPFSQLEWYLQHRVKKRGLRFELPYQERIKRHGEQLKRRLHETGIEWWDHQLTEYEPLPKYERFSDIWINYAKEVGREPAEFPFWALSSRSMQFSWGANVGLPVIHEMAQNVAGHDGVIMNRTAARKLGINDGDPITIESAAGITRGRAQLREGIRPDTIVMVGQFDHWATPVAKDYGLASLNSVTALSLSLTDATGSGADVMRVAVHPGDWDVAGISA